MTLFWCKFGLGKHFGMASRSNHWTDCHRLWYKIHFSPHSTIWLKKDGSLLLSSIREDNTSKQGFFFFFSQLMRHKIIKLSQLYTLLQMLNSHRMVSVECFRNFSFSCKRISFDDPLSWSLSTSNGRPLYLSSTVFFSLEKLLEPPLHCTFICSSWAKCIVDVARCLFCFRTHFEVE